jgi:ATP-dependent Lon protease
LGSSKAIAELDADKEAKALLMPVSARRWRNNLPSDLGSKISIEFYIDPQDAMFKRLENRHIAMYIHLKTAMNEL